MVINPPSSLRPVVLVHGVGIGARSLDRLAAVLDRSGRRAVVLDRPGYRRTAGPAPIAAQAAWLITACGEVAPLVDLIGVSGGATVALAAVCADPSGFGRVVLHEPLVGPLEPSLHASIAESAAALAADPSTDELLAFVRRLVGNDTMEHLDAGVVDDLVRSQRTVRAEVPFFASFAPDALALAALVDADVELVSTVGGARQAPPRHAAAAVLERLAGASTIVLSGAGHLAQVDDPHALAEVLVGRRHAAPCGAAADGGAQ